MTDATYSAYALILAGGEGTRFAPLSTPERPKQFLPLVGDQSLIRQTVDRIQALIPAAHLWVATNVRYLPQVREHLPEIPESQVIGETCKKNTAPAIAIAAMGLHRRDPNAVMVVLPSDHVIVDADGFRSVLKKAIAFAARHDVLVTLGIQPTFASPEYGYIERGVAEEPGIFRVRRFVEKPDSATAASYLKAGTYSWNSGMFVWRASVILEDVARFLPDIHSWLQKIEWQGDSPTLASVRDYFEGVASVSIDYGIMEQSERAVVIPASIGWHDVGTWDSLRCLAESGAVCVPPNVQKLITEHATSR